MSDHDNNSEEIKSILPQHATLPGYMQQNYLYDQFGTVLDICVSVVTAHTLLGNEIKEKEGTDKVYLCLLLCCSLMIIW